MAWKGVGNGTRLCRKQQNYSERNIKFKKKEVKQSIIKPVWIISLANLKLEKAKTASMV